MNAEDIRWKQRFSSFNKALKKLIDTVNYIKKNHLDSNLQEIVKQGLIQSFEFTHELAWNTMKDYAFYQGNSSIGGSRDATREALQINLIQDGRVWMEMISSRNKTSHTYNEETANEIFEKIIEEYLPAFIEFQKIMEKK